MHITRATIIRGFGPDKVVLWTDLPEPTYPFEGKLTLQFSATANTGEAYVEEHWPKLQMEIINRTENKHGYSESPSHQS